MRCAGGCDRLMWKSPTSLPEGQAICKICRNATKPSCNAHDIHRRDCIHCRMVAEKVRSRRRHGVSDVQAFVCTHCHKPFQREPKRGQRPRHCSDKCANEARRLRRRARLVGGWVEDFSRIEIFQRDNWTCQICHRKVRRNVKWPHPMAAVVDHIIPLAAGGTHQRSNVQCAHNVCNTTKGAGAAGDQLRLIG